MLPVALNFSPNLQVTLPRVNTCLAKAKPTVQTSHHKVGRNNNKKINKCIFVLGEIQVWNGVILKAFGPIRASLTIEQGHRHHWNPTVTQSEKKKPTQKLHQLVAWHFRQRGKNNRQRYCTAARTELIPPLFHFARVRAAGAHCSNISAGDGNLEERSGSPYNLEHNTWLWVLHCRGST